MIGERTGGQVQVQSVRAADIDDLIDDPCPETVGAGVFLKNDVLKPHGRGCVLINPDVEDCDRPISQIILTLSLGAQIDHLSLHRHKRFPHSRRKCYCIKGLDSNIKCNTQRPWGIGSYT